MPTASLPFQLQSTAQSPLTGVIDLPDQGGPRPTVVICHGFKGFLDWGFFPAIAGLLSQSGMTVVRFNLSGTGMQPGDELVTDLEAFRTNTHSRELGELLAVLAALGTEIAPGRIDLDRVGLLGHSRGGGNAVLAAATPPWAQRLRALVTWAAIARVDRYSEEQKRSWRCDGELPAINARTGQRLALGVGLLEDLERHRAELDILTAAGQARSPWLIMHGSADESVPAGDAQDLAAAAAAAGRPHELLLIEGGSHTFGSRHPFAGPTRDLIAALNATQTWLQRHL